VRRCDVRGAWTFSVVSRAEKLGPGRLAAIESKCYPRDRSAMRVTVLLAFLALLLVGMTRTRR
jgi:hypothetical protein